MWVYYVWQQGGCDLCSWRAGQSLTSPSCLRHMLGRMKQKLWCFDCSRNLDSVECLDVLLWRQPPLKMTQVQTKVAAVLPFFQFCISCFIPQSRVGGTSKAWTSKARVMTLMYTGKVVLCLPSDLILLRGLVFLTRYLLNKTFSGRFLHFKAMHDLF